MAKINFTFHVQKTGNLFHFIANLTEWHFSCRKETNKDWIRKTGPLTAKEKDALKNFAKILKKYPFGKNYIGRILQRYNGKVALKRLQKKITAEEYRVVIDVFNIFKPRFEKVWKEEGQHLKKIEKALKATSFGQDEIIPILNNLAKPTRKRNFKVFLLISGDQANNGGGANIGDLTLEIGTKLHLDEIKSVFPTLWHEFFHLCYGPSINKIISNFLKENTLPKEVLQLGYNGETQTFLNEAVTCMLFPGYLAETVFGRKPYSLKDIAKMPKNVYSAQKYICLTRKPIVTKYINQKKMIDGPFLHEMIKGYKDYLKFMKNIQKENITKTS